MIAGRLGRGFERYYGFLGGDTNQYYPELVYDNHSVEPEKTPEEGYHLTEDLADKAISFIADSKQVAPNKPFFLYFCPGAQHAPASRSEGVGGQVQGQVRRRLGRLSREDVSSGRRNLGSFRKTPSSRATIPTSRTGTRSRRTRKSCMPA